MNDILNFDPNELPIDPIEEQYQHPASVRNEVYNLYRSMQEFGLYIENIHIISCKKTNYGYEVSISITSNSVMDRENLQTSIEKVKVL